MYTIYSREEPPCLFCMAAKRLLTDKGEAFENLVIGETITLDDFKAKFPDQRTVPLIFKGDKKIGGYDELKKHMELENLSL